MRTERISSADSSLIGISGTAYAGPASSSDDSAEPVTDVSGSTTATSDSTSSTAADTTLEPWIATAYDASGNVLASAQTTDMTVEPDDPASGILTMPYRDERSRYRLYRGSMHLMVTAAGLDTINVLPVESYLRSTVSAEMPASWPAAALEAQAVAARTYAWEHIHASKDWDLVPTSANQNYLGYQHEYASTDAAIQATANQIMTYNGSPIAPSTTAAPVAIRRTASTRS